MPVILKNKNNGSNYKNNDNNTKILSEVRKS